MPSVWRWHKERSPCTRRWPPRSRPPSRPGFVVRLRWTMAPELAGPPARIRLIVRARLAAVRMGGHPGRLRLRRSPHRPPRTRVVERRRRIHLPTPRWWRTSLPPCPSRPARSDSPPGPSCCCEWPSPIPTASSGSPSSDSGTTSSNPPTPPPWPPPWTAMPSPRTSRPACSTGWPSRPGTTRRRCLRSSARPREPLRDEELSPSACPILVVLGDRDMTTSRRPAGGGPPVGHVRLRARRGPLRHSLDFG